MTWLGKLIIYKYMKNIRSTHDIPTSMYLTGVKATSDLDMASLFKSYFHSVCQDDSIANLSNPTILIGNIGITEEVYETLAPLDTMKSTGPDGIGLKILKCCAVTLYGPVHHLYTPCLTQDQIPRNGVFTAQSLI